MPTSEGRGKQCHTGSPKSRLLFSAPPSASNSESLHRFERTSTASLADPIRSFHRSVFLAVFRLHAARSAKQTEGRILEGCTNDKLLTMSVKRQVPRELSYMHLQSNLKDSGSGTCELNQLYYDKTIHETMLTGARSFLKVQPGVQPS